MASEFQAIDLFAGAGGLAIGTSLAGFRHAAIVELENAALQTLKHNRDEGPIFAKEWNLVRADLTNAVFSGENKAIDLLTAGPPCQPFSLGGIGNGHRDARNLFPQTIELIRQIRPRAILIENVQGLRRKKFEPYLRYIELQLRFPELQAHDGERWQAHSNRLAMESRHENTFDLSYDIHKHWIDAADYGVPQRRKRLFIVGFRRDQSVRWKLPPPTHSLVQLVRSKWISGDYWEKHEISRNARTGISPIERARLIDCSDVNDAELAPWFTVRDALADLPRPKKSRHTDYFNHIYVPGARPYHGHTGSGPDFPAKTLKAGVHGVPGGENMLRSRNGRVRYFTIRESARLQTFPDGYEFRGAWTAMIRQIGNAVPVEIARTLASAIKLRLTN